MTIAANSASSSRFSRARIRIEAGSFPFQAVTSVPISTITFWRSHGIDRFFTDNLARLFIRLARARAYWSQN